MGKPSILLMIAGALSVSAWAPAQRIGNIYANYTLTAEIDPDAATSTIATSDWHRNDGISVGTPPIHVEANWDATNVGAGVAEIHVFPAIERGLGSDPLGEGDFDFTLGFTLNSDSMAQIWLTNAVGLYYCENGVWEDLLVQPDRIGSLYFSGFLAAGMYEVRTIGEILAGEDQYGTIFDAQFTPVPEPATMAIVSLGVAALLRRRRN